MNKLTLIKEALLGVISLVISNSSKITNKVAVIICTCIIALVFYFCIGCVATGLRVTNSRTGNSMAVTDESVKVLVDDIQVEMQYKETEEEKVFSEEIQRVLAE
jgi:hypothetical protein